MTPLMAAEKICEFLKESFDAYDETSDKYDAESHAYGPVNVYVGYPPVVKKASDKGKLFPFVSVHPSVVKDLEDETVVSVDIIVETYDEDQVNGDKTLYHLLEFIRNAILTKRPEGYWTLKPGTMQTEIPPDQPYPCWVGTVFIDVSIPQPVPNFSDELF